ncbi:ferric reductase NAD binding domain-containing protein [Pelagophyceae sp. CCMP2097]|nr:ferric reductase NAD binding domain-containing protein [Pelagophyceae sp. CCMP2097]
MASNWSSAGPYYPYAKGAGNVLNVLMAAIFLPMCRNILTFLRSTDIARCVPLDHAAAFHKFLAFAVLVVTAVHAGCHYADFAWKARRSGPSVAASAGSFESASGHAILALVVIMSLTSRDGVRRAKFKVGRRAAGWFSSSWAAATSAARTVGGHTIFWVAHHLWVAVVLLMLAHAQHFWLWVAWPLARFLLDKAISARRADLDVVIIRVAEPPKDVVHLDLRLASGRALKYKPGQFVFINCPEISQRKWHPFTLSSSPEQRTHFSVHIRCQSTLDWCHALRNHLRAAVSENDAGDDGAAPRESCVAPPPPPQTPPPPAARRPSGTAARARGGKDAAAATWEVRTTLEGNKYEVDVETGETRWCTGAAVAGVARCLPVVKVDGPYGAPAEAVYDYSVLVLVGAGIGITPFASILKTIAIQKRNKTEETPIERVYLNWICRDVAEFDSFAALLDDIKNDAALKPFFDLSIYITGELRLKDVCPKTTGGLNSFAGRPNWNRIFKEVAAAHCEAQREIGVFFCGPSAIGNQLSVACRMFTTLKTRGGTKFAIHSDNF